MFDCKEEEKIVFHTLFNFLSPNDNTQYIFPFCGSNMFGIYEIVYVIFFITNILII